MNELTRMQYLDAMGIDMFVPCINLPNAKTSTLCVLPSGLDLHSPANTNPLLAGESQVGTQAQPLSSSFVDSDTDNVNQPVVVANVLADLLPNKKHTYKEPSTNESSVMNEMGADQAKHPDLNPPALIPDTDIPTSAEFTVGLWRVSDHIQVVDSRQQGDALPTDVLLANILRMHDLLPLINGSHTLPKQEILHWPLPDVQLEDTSWHAAHEMVMSFLEGRLLANPVTHFVLFGEDAFRAVMGSNVEFNSVLYQTVAVDAFVADAIVLPSLRHFLYHPMEKKLLWPIFQLLSRRIASLTESH